MFASTHTMMVVHAFTYVTEGLRPLTPADLAAGNVDNGAFRRWFNSWAARHDAVPLGQCPNPHREGLGGKLGGGCKTGNEDFSFTNYPKWRSDYRLKGVRTAVSRMRRN